MTSGGLQNHGHRGWHLVLASFSGGLLGSAARGGCEAVCAGIGAPSWTARIVINVLGAFLIGLLFARLAARRPDGAPEGVAHGQRWREHLWGAGFLGGFTTVSGFAWDAAGAVRAQECGALALMMAANAVVGVAACALGWRVAASRGR